MVSVISGCDWFVNRPLLPFLRVWFPCGHSAVPFAECGVQLVTFAVVVVTNSCERCGISSFVRGMLLVKLLQGLSERDLQTRDQRSDQVDAGFDFSSPSQ